jgi:glucose/arabinose dehydrogenase
MQLLLLGPSALLAQSPQVAQTLLTRPGKSITLTMPRGLSATVAIRGIPRIRFLTQSPDGRIFATSMYNLADNTRGAIFILDGWNAQTHTFARAIPYLTHLRNPNNVAFYTDPATKKSWIYVPLTDQLLRYPYTAGSDSPAGPPQTLMHFPDYGLNYKYGGWHLTRTVALATLHGETRLYIAAGSSCNYCRELEAQRAAIISMRPDGADARIVAHGMRNAVDLRFIPNLDGGALFATNMGDDHLGDKLPEDTFFELDSNDQPGPIAAATATRAPNYGWPTCYFGNGHAILDHTALPDNPGPDDDAVAEHPGPSADSKPAGNDSVYAQYAGAKQATGNTAAQGTNLAARNINESDLPKLGPAPAPLTTCEHVPPAYTTFAAHSSPLGLAYFGDDNTVLRDSFLVALHGASHTRIGTGYRLVRFTAADHTPRDWMTGFLTHNGAALPTVHGRPCGILRTGPDSFLLTDDLNGLVYAIYPAKS